MRPGLVGLWWLSALQVFHFESTLKWTFFVISGRAQNLLFFLFCFRGTYFGTVGVGIFVKAFCGGYFHSEKDKAGSLWSPKIIYCSRCYPYLIERVIIQHVNDGQWFKQLWQYSFQELLELHWGYRQTDYLTKLYFFFFFLFGIDWWTEQYYEGSSILHKYVWVPLAHSRQQIKYTIW